MRSASAPTIDHAGTAPPTPSATRVLVWRAGSRAALDAHLRAYRDAGWRVERCEPRVTEGPAYGALVVLRWAERPSRTENALPDPAPQRMARRPRPRPLPSPPATPDATAA